MTNEKAIELLKNILPKKVSYANLIGASCCYGDDFVYEAPEPYAIEFAINSLEENTKLKAEIERLKELMPKICETCEYEDEIGYEEPCNSCNNRRNWKLKDEE